MHQAREYRTSLILAAAMAGVGLMSGSAAHAQIVATEAPLPAHHWDEHENAAYHRYIVDQRYPYRAYGSLNEQEQRDYWDWRATHPG
jgi:hypothetical protein